MRDPVEELGAGVGYTWPSIFGYLLVNGLSFELLGDKPSDGCLMDNAVLR